MWKTIASYWMRRIQRGTGPTQRVGVEARAPRVAPERVQVILDRRAQRMLHQSIDDEDGAHVVEVSVLRRRYVPPMPAWRPSYIGRPAKSNVSARRKSRCSGPAARRRSPSPTTALARAARSWTGSRPRTGPRSRPLRTARTQSAGVAARDRALRAVGVAPERLVDVEPRERVLDDHLLVRGVEVEPQARAVVDHDQPAAAGPQHAVQLAQDRLGVARVVEDALALHEVDRRVGERDRDGRVAALDQLHALRGNVVQGEPIARQLERPRRHVEADDLLRAGVQRVAGEIVARPAAVVEDHLAVVLTPQPCELAEQRVLLEPPLEERLGIAGPRERLGRDRVLGPVLVDRGALAVAAVPHLRAGASADPRREAPHAFLAATRQLPTWSRCSRSTVSPASVSHCRTVANRGCEKWNGSTAPRGVR